LYIPGREIENEKIGYGYTTLAQLIVQAGLSDVVLYDIVEGMPQGKALDMMEASSLWDVSVNIRGVNDLKDISGSHIVVITAGAARKPGMSRDDLLNINAGVVRTVSKGIAEYCPESIVIVVTNPMDVMAQLCRAMTGFPAERVMGMGGVLDSARFRTFVAEELGVSAQDVDALVLGGHGDRMVPMPRYTTVRGVPITDLLPAGKIESLIERTRNGGAEIVSLLKTAASAFQMVRAILLDEKRVVPAAVRLNGEYGIDGLYAGVPVVVGSKGVERIIELRLEGDEKAFYRFRQ